VTSVRLKKLASWALPISVSLAILILLYRGIPARSLLEGLARIDLRWAAAYVILSALEPLLRGARWNDLIDARNRAGSIRAVYIAKATNNILPLRAGDAVRAQFARDLLGVSYSRSVVSLLAELAMDLFFLCLLGTAFALLWSKGRAGMALACAGGIVAVASVVLALWKRPGSGPGAHAGGLRRLAGMVRWRAGSIVSGPGGRKALGWSVLLWTYTVAMTFCGLRMCLPSVTVEGAVAAIVFVYLSVLVPSAPGFIGTYHAAIAGSMALMGYPLEAYPLAPLLVHLLQFLPQTIIGLAAGLRYLLGNDWRESLSRLRQARLSLREGRI